MQRLAAILASVFLAFCAVPGSGRLLPGMPERTLLSEGTFNYQRAGEDWPESFPGCGGSAQSPINIITSEARMDPQDLTVRFVTFGKGRGVSVFNTGHALEVAFEETEGTSVLMPVVGGVVNAAIDPLDPNHDKTLDVADNGTFSFANVEVLQFHFHISSENALNGFVYPMEAHLVTRVPQEEVPSCGESGCLVVFAVLFKITDSANFFIEPFFDQAPDKAGEEFAEELPEGFVINFDELIPNKKSYYTWSGSLTTPPCTEGVTWVLFDHFGKISQGQLTLLQSKMSKVRKTCQEEAGDDFEALELCASIGDLKNNRATQPLNDRLVSHVGNPSPTR